MVLGILGFFGFLISIVMVVISGIKKNGKVKTWCVVMAVCFVALVVGVMSVPASSEPININIDEFKSQSTTILYDDLARNTEKYIESKVNFTGEIVQIHEIGARKLILRVNVTKSDYGFFEDTIWANYTMKPDEKHFLEGDIVNLWGTVKGRRSYTSVLGDQITIPEIDAAIIELDK